MYLVFIAMMALNVSSEVLDGFELVEGSLRTSIDNTSTRNEIVTEELKAYYQTNPEKVREWYEKGTKVKKASDSLYNYVQDLKVRIAQIADGKDADVNNIDHKDDLEAASRVMLSPVSGEGKKLRQSIEKYRTLMGEMVEDSAKTRIIEASLSTTPPHKAGINTRTWEEALFENMPVAAAVTLLTKLQSDIRYARLSCEPDHGTGDSGKPDRHARQPVQGQYRLIGCRLDETSDRLCERQGIAL